MADDLQLLAMEVERELRLTQQELLLKRELLEKTRDALQASATSLQDARAEVSRNKTEVQELKAQVQVRFKATQRLEEENTYLRDTVARLRAQGESYLGERQLLLDRCQAAEKELQGMREEVQSLRKDLQGVDTFKEGCFLIQAQTRKTIETIISKQAALTKDQAQLERVCSEGLSFAQEVARESSLQLESVKRATLERANLEEKLVHIAAQCEDMRKERDRVMQQQSGASEKADGCYLDEWAAYQHAMKDRLEGLLEANQRLSEELTLTKRCDTSGE